MRIVSSEEFEKGNELVLDIPARRSHMFLINDGFVPEVNQEDCIPLALGDREFNNMFNLTGFFLFSYLKIILNNFNYFW